MHEGRIQMRLVIGWFTANITKLVQEKIDQGLKVQLMITSVVVLRCTFSETNESFRVPL